MAWFLLLLALARAVTAQKTIQSKDELKSFFATTYIEKERGHFSIIQERTKVTYAEGYEPSWGFHRFHHVCFRGGGDGIYTSLEGVLPTKKLSEDDITFQQWNDYIGNRYPKNCRNMNLYSSILKMK